MSFVMSLGRAAAFFAVVVLSACGGGDGEVGADAADQGPQVDAMVEVGCGIAESLGAVGDLSATAVVAPQDMTDPDGPRYIKGVAPLVAASQRTPYDATRLELFDGYGSFADGMYGPSPDGAPFEIKDDDAAYATCGVCFLLDIDVDYSSNPPEQLRTLFATAGSIEVTSVEGTLIYSATDLSLVEIGPEPGFAPVPGGCTASIASLSVNGPIESSP